jgi:predicted amidophosphoribosyltransferase
VFGAACIFCCAYPFEYEMPEETLCTACLRERSKFDRARSVLAYDDSSWLLVIEFKHADKTFAAQTLAGMTCRAGAELLDDAGLIKPVPLHLRRLFACGYIRPRFWPPRYRGKPTLPYPWTCGCGGVTQNRRTNVADCVAAQCPGRFFDTSEKRQVGDARVLLIDDVLTTGATVGECGRVDRRSMS